VLVQPSQPSREKHAPSCWQLNTLTNVDLEQVQCRSCLEAVGDLLGNQPRVQRRVVLNDEIEVEVEVDRDWAWCSVVESMEDGGTYINTAVHLKCSRISIEVPRATYD
jgi:hypothetical protein